MLGAVAAMELLADVAPPPTSVSSHPENAWVSVQRRLGSRLPADYLRFVDAYGPVELGEYLRVLDPFAGEGELLAELGPQLARLRHAKLKSADSVPHPLWHEPGGLLPWGSSAGGEVFYWRTVGQPDRWTVVAGSARGEFESYAMGLVEFVARWLSGQLTSGFLPDDLQAKVEARLPVVRE